MTGMEIFNVIVGVSTMISLIVSIFVATKVISIHNSVSVSSRDNRNTTTGNQTIRGSGNNQSGGSIG